MSVNQYILAVANLSVAKKIVKVIEYVASPEL